MSQDTMCRGLAGKSGARAIGGAVRFEGRMRREMRTYVVRVGRPSNTLCASVLIRNLRAVSVKLMVVQRLTIAAT